MGEISFNEKKKQSDCFVSEQKENIRVCFMYKNKNNAASFIVEKVVMCAVSVCEAVLD